MMMMMVYTRTSTHTQIDYIDESEVLTMADEQNHINKNKFKVPFVCGCRDLGEALVSHAFYKVSAPFLSFVPCLLST